MAQQQHKRQLKNYLLNKRYQLRFTLFMVAVCALLMAGLGLYVMRHVESVTKISINDLDKSQAYLQDADKEKAHLLSRERMMRMILIGTGVVVSVGLFLYGIKMTHKVAGPLYKVTLYFDKVKNGKFDPVYGLRKGDQLIEFYDHFREAHSALRKRQEEDVAVLKGVVASAEKVDLASRSPETAAALEELRALLKAKEVSLG